jgi:hypothetical protein
MPLFNVGFVIFPDLTQLGPEADIKSMERRRLRGASDSTVDFTAKRNKVDGLDQ